MAALQQCHQQHITPVVTEHYLRQMYLYMPGQPQRQEFIVIKQTLIIPGWLLHLEIY